MKTWILLGMVSAFLPLGGCRIHTVEKDPPPPVEVPRRFSGGGRGLPSPDPWWKDFGDPDLAKMIQDTLSGNLDLKGAWARLEQARALARKAGAPLWPSIQISGNVSRTHQTFLGGGAFGNFSFTTDQYTLTAAASYELDLWGKLRDRRSAALLDMGASRKDLEAMAMSLSAQVADTWFQLREARAQVRLLHSQIETSRALLDLVKRRFGQGLATALDVSQQKQQVASLLSQVPPVESRLQVLRHQLNLLRGKPPNAPDLPGEESADLPEPPPLPPTGLPADLLVRRPDVAAARLRVTAADHRLGAAIAEHLPSIQLTPRAGYQAPNARDLFQSWIWSLAAGFTAPFFEGGRIQAEVERTRAVKLELLQAFGKTFLQALGEVEDALVRERKQREYLAALDRQLRAARSNLEEARRRYLHGLNDYLPVLTALSTCQQVQRALITAKRDLLSYRIQLYRALGGDWTGRLGPHGTLAAKGGGKP